MTAIPRAALVVALVAAVLTALDGLKPYVEDGWTSDLPELALLVALFVLLELIARAEAFVGRRSTH